MGLLEYVRVLVRRGWLILLLAALAGGAAYALSLRQMPVYRATQVVLVQPSRIDLGLTQATNITLNNLRAWVDSSLRAQTVIDRLRLDMRPDQLIGATTITANQNNLTLQIDVDLYNGDLANDIARTWGELVVDYRERENQLNRREDRVNATLQDVPRYTLLRPRPAVNALAGVLGGVLLGGVIVFVLELLEHSVVRSRADVEDGVQLPVLAVVPSSDAA